MQIVRTGGGEAVAVMQVKELLMTETALMRYLMQYPDPANPDSSLACRMLSEISRANDEAAAVAGQAVEDSAAS
ncbi:hypothetical protein [Streptomyces decoyicus]